MAPNFSALLSKTADEVVKPPPMPGGTYLTMITGHEFGQSSQKKTDFIQFNLRYVEAAEDVDEDELKEIPNFTERKGQVKFYLTEDALWRLTEFLQEHVGIEGSGRAINEMIPETMNQPVGVYVTQQLNAEKGETYSVVDRTLNWDKRSDS